MQTTEKNSSSPFTELDISSADFLDSVSERSICGRCYKSRKYFCYTCHIPMEVIEDKIPRLRLPIQVDIIKYPKEIDGKSTATHAAILAPDNVRIYNYPQIPNIIDVKKVLIVFPGKQSITLDEVYGKIRAQHNVKSADDNIYIGDDEADMISPTIRDESRCLPRISVPNHEKNKSTLKSNFPFERIIFIDSTWNQVQKINNDVRLEEIQRVELKTRESNFWRYQRGKPHTYLSTIEAIYYFLVDMHCIFIENNYNGEYDNLLFFFRFMYNKIHSLYDHDKLKAYSLRNNNVKIKGNFNY